jgi:hypothetical protein
MSLVYSAPAGATTTTPSDHAATHAYLEATLLEGRAEAAAQPDGLKVIEELAARVRAGCAGILAGSPLRSKTRPPDQSATEMKEELFSSSLLAAEHPSHPAFVRFANKVHRLGWSNPRLTRLLHSFAAEAAEQSAIPTPDLCADARAWIASGYRAVSAGTKQFLHRLDVVSSITLIEPEPHEPLTFNSAKTIAYRLKPYEDRTDRALARRLLEREVKITDPRVRPFFEAAGKVLAILEGSAGG